MMARILIVGGAGYIGSHMVKMLLGNGAEVVTLDDLSKGYRDAVLGGRFVEGSLADKQLLRDVLTASDFDAVMHFASFIEVGESVRDPRKYYENNLTNTLNLLDAMLDAGVKGFVFSSTAAVYGTPEHVSITEQHVKAPINPYGASKWMVEQVLQDYDRAYGLKSVCLRYFNAAGADPDGELGERHDPETHLIPLVLQAASGRLAHISVFGRDYDTPDGTCIRDYVHVTDLCDAHLLALHHLETQGGSAVFNLGNGEGFSVQQVIDTARAVTEREIPVVYADRRAGDPPRLVADSGKARQVLGWKPKYSDLATMIEHAWRWERRLARG